MNKSVFFDAVRDSLFDGRLSQTQVDGMDAMLTAWEDGADTGDIRHLAYTFATAHHETGRRMIPVEEMGGPRYFRDMYDIRGKRPSVARTLGNVQPGDGARYHGRGRVQVTGRRNYTRLAALTGQPLDERPELMLDPKIDSFATFYGMREGIYTGKRLADYFNARANDPVNARRIINGTDKAQLIAGYHRKYLDALRAAA
jgi:hypothetical protein